MFKKTPLTPLCVANRGLIFGVGVNDADYSTSYVDEYGRRFKCPQYLVWKGMIQRCFDSKFLAKRPTYQGCSVDPSWLSFSIFKSWMDQQDWKNKHLDKDLLSKGHYSPSTCLFISPLLNALLSVNKIKRGSLPLGVSLSVKKGITYYVATCSAYGKQQTLGYFKTATEASSSYRAHKLAYIAELAKNEKNPRIAVALLNLQHTHSFT